MKRRRKYRKRYIKTVRHKLIRMWSRQLIITAGYMGLKLLGMRIPIIGQMIFVLLLICFARTLYYMLKQASLLREKLIYLTSNISEVDKLDGIQFERYLCAHFKKKGYKVYLTPPSHDYGVDLIIKRGKEVIAIQAKRYNYEKGYTVNYKAVQEVAAGKAYYGCNKGIVVSNSIFTDQAKELAKVNDIDLWDRDRLIKEFNIMTAPRKDTYLVPINYDNMLIFD